MPDWELLGTYLEACNVRRSVRAGGSAVGPGAVSPGVV